ncbi:MAG TPA: serine/threonine-protein kinase [Gemmatimonadales bacterium]|jgi:serine/threonine protein kinase
MITSLVDTDVDAPALFDRTRDLLGDLFEPVQIVAASRERVLFVARDVVLKREVGLRIHLQPGTASRALHERETDLLAQLDHPVIRPVYAAGVRGDWAYRVTKWIEGESLGDAVARGARPIPDVLRLARDLTHALQYVHVQRIVIRRLTPASVMLEAHKRAIIIDLRSANACLDVGAAPVTEPEAAVYLAPEVRDGAIGEPGSDIYAVGALLYLAITGQPPALDRSQQRRPRVLRPACPEALERVILRALELDASDRYLTAAEMYEDLRSDVGDMDEPLVYTGVDYATEDPRTWEKRLRRALGDEYELLGELGSGGFGRVYLVRDLNLEREAALKVLHPYLTADPGVVERFRREARTAAQLVHPNIVDVFDIGGRTGLQWYTMEYVEGRSLDRIVAAEGKLSLARVLRMLFEGLDALSLAHSKQLVHRDLKPENLLIEEATGTLRIADFGLVLALGGKDRYGGASSRSGTPAFAAPEQLLGESVDHRADLYSLTLSAYFALLGDSPFGGGSLVSLLARQTAGRLPALSTVRDDVPAEVEGVLARCASADPADRYPDARAYLSALRDAGRAGPARWRRLFEDFFGGGA